MPNWKKVIVSGSDASLSTIVASGNITGSGNLEISGNISGSSTSTGSFGRVEAITISGDGSALSNIASIPWISTGSYYSANSDLQVTGSFTVLGNISGSFAGLSAGQRYQHNQTSAATTWTVSHNFDLQYVNVDVYDSNDQIVIPTSITATDSNTLTLTFGSAVSGNAIVSTGGQASDERGKNVIHNQSSATTNWRVTHSIGEQYPAVTVYDDNDNVIIPEQIKATDGSKMDITFTEAVSGNANISVGGGIASGTMTGSAQVVESLPSGTISSSAQIATDISGSFGTVSGSVSTRVTTTEASGALFDGTGAVTFATVDTGQGANELYDMDQNVKTDSAVTFATVDTGQGANELYDMDQNVKTDSAVTFATVDTGQGANELYDMDQNVKTDSAVTFTTVNTGQGANELYDMDQNVLTTSSPTFADITATGTVTAQEFHTEFVSASILYTSGSTKFGDTIDDTHQFSGSQYVSGSVTATSFTGIFNGALSGSAQIASNISGSWQGAIDISSDTNLVGGTNITLTGDTLNVDDAFLINDGNDTTSGTITAGGFTTTGNISGSVSQAIQTGITTAANLTTVGTIGTGTWEGTTVAVAQGGTGVTSKTGTTNVVLSNSPTLVTPALGTPSALVGTNISGTASNLTAGLVTNGVYTTNHLGALAATTSAQLRGVISDETGTGTLVFATSPTLVTPALGTPASGVLTSTTGYPGDSSLVTTGTVTAGVWNSTFGSTANALISGSFSAASSSLETNKATKGFTIAMSVAL
jgi:hypothetical protein